MILDDGGDLTTLVHEKYPQYLKGKLFLRLDAISGPDELPRHSRSL